MLGNSLGLRPSSFFSRSPAQMGLLRNPSRTNVRSPIAPGIYLSSITFELQSHTTSVQRAQGPTAVDTANLKVPNCQGRK